MSLFREGDTNYLIRKYFSLRPFKIKKNTEEITRKYDGCILKTSEKVT